MVREYQIKLIESFNGFCRRQETGEAPWASFDRWVRDALGEFVGARRVRCFQALGSGERLVSLTTQLEEPLWPPAGLPGLVTHVLATGRSYVCSDPANGESVHRLAQQWTTANMLTPGLRASAPHWLLPIRTTHQTTGLVLAGELSEPALRDHPGLAAVGDLLTLFWRYVSQTQALAVAERTDRTSGVLTWTDLSAAAQQALTESAREGEPVVVLALALEGIRRLDDGGHWTLRDQLMRQVGGQMLAKLRSDDLVGRFSEDRFVAVLRRLDFALGRVIAGKLLATVESALSENQVLRETVKIRCGLSDAGGGDFETAVGRAFEALRLARQEDQSGPVTLAAVRPEEQLSGSRPRSTEPAETCVVS